MSSKVGHFLKTNIKLLLAFFCLSILSVIILASSKMVGGAFDLQFNWQRIYELRASFAHFNFFPQVALNEFNQDGSAVMSLYPYMNLIPAAFLSYLIPSFIPLVYVLFILRTFTSLLVSYFTSYNFNHNKRTSFLFAVSYSMSSLVMTYCFHNMDMGISAAMLFMPIILFGFLKLLENGSWLQLSIGMSLTIFSHILSSIFIVSLLIVLLLINYKKINEDLIKNLATAVVTTLLTTAVFWFPFVNIMFQNQINPPMNFGLTASTGWGDLLAGGLLNLLVYSVSTIALLGFILAIFKYRVLGKYSKQMFWVSIAALIVCSNWFPWHMLSTTAVNVIQFPWRIYILPQLMLCYLFANTFTKFFANERRKQLATILITCFIVFLQFGSQLRIVHEYQSYQDLNHLYADNGNLNVPVMNGEIAYKISKDSDLQNILKSEELDKDYYPTSSLVWYNSIVRHQGIYDVNKNIDMKLLGNGRYSFSNTDPIQEFNLPFLAYNGINYTVKLDNKTIPSHINGTSLLTINNVAKGNHTLQVIVDNNGVLLFSIFLFLVSLLEYGFLLYRKISGNNISGFDVFNNFMEHFSKKLK